MRIEESIFIRRPTDVVFRFFNDRSNDRRWMVTVHESEWLDAGDVTAVGRRGRMVMEAMGRREFTDVVTAYEPGRLVAHRSDDGTMTFHTGCAATPEGSGTRAKVWFEPERLPGGMFGRLLAPFVARTVRRNFRADLERLKRILEAEVTAA